MVGFNPGAFVQGHQAGAQMQGQREDRQMKQEQLKMMKQSHQMEMRTSENANYEMDMIKAAMKENEGKQQERFVAQLTVAKDKAASDYIFSMSKDTFLLDNQNKFGGNMKILQDLARLANPKGGVPSAPNFNDPDQRQQVKTWLMSNDEDFMSLSSEDQEMQVNMNMSSGELMVSPDGQIVDLQTLIGSLGMNPGVDANKRLDDFLTMKNRSSQAKLGKLRGDNLNTPSELVASLQEKKNNGTIQPSEDIQLTAALKEMKINKEYAIQQINGEHGRKLVGTVKDGSVTEHDAAQLMNWEMAAGQKPSEALRTETTTMIGVIGSGNKLMTKFANAKDGDYEFGAVENFGKTMKTVLASYKDADGKAKAFESLTRNEQLSVLNTVALRTGAGTLFADYVKVMSGAAVSEQEFDRLSKIFYGGDVDYVNIQTMQTALGSFINQATGKVRSAISTNAHAYPGSMANASRELNNVASRTHKPSDAIRGSGTWEPSTAEVGKEMVDQVTNVAGDMLSAGFEGLGFGGSSDPEVTNSFIPKSIKDIANKVKDRFTTREPVPESYGEDVTDSMELTEDHMKKLKAAKNGTKVKGGYIIWNHRVYKRNK